jgi:hypothetical protein
MKRSNLKVGSKVVPSKSNIRWHVAHEEIYARPSSGYIDPRYLDDIFYWRAAKLGCLGKGKVIQVRESYTSGEKLYYVKFTSKAGKTSAWFSLKDLVYAQ